MAREAVVVDSVRTGLTKANRGSFNITEPVEYTAHVLRELVARHANLDAEEIEDVILGCGMPEGCQGLNMARIAAMAAGLPQTVAATTVNRFCSSGSQAIMMAAHAILHEGAEVAIGAGVETITMMQDGTQNVSRIVNPTAQKRFPGLYFPMGLTAEVVAERYGVSREDQDRYALMSQQRYANAVETGKISEEIVPMNVTRKVIKQALIDSIDLERRLDDVKMQIAGPRTKSRGVRFDLGFHSAVPELSMRREVGQGQIKLKLSAPGAMGLQYRRRGTDRSKVHVGFDGDDDYQLGYVIAF